ncbi:MAG: enoyl-CoA hydratase/isomerase family protein [Deltaproteobacteria bacterium]|nr:enoyl-CoA hydratase/isomerase family protein [Deltaproteobacteria bacterium]
MSDAIKVKTGSGLAVITLARPNAFNSFDLEMIGGLAENLVRMALDPDVVGIAITGEGKAFCAGGDLRWLSVYKGDPDAAFHELAARYHQAILEIKRMPKPVVAAINGLAAGGGFSLALACDFRVMEATAVLKQGYTSNGLSIDGGGTYSLPRLVGLARALEIAAFDRAIPADQALSWGLVTEVVGDGKSLDRALALLEELRKMPLSSFAASKELLTASFDTPFEVTLEKERQALSQCAVHPNGREGVAAFLEKRKPLYNR